MLCGITHYKLCSMAIWLCKFCPKYTFFYLCACVCGSWLGRWVNDVVVVILVSLQHHACVCDSILLHAYENLETVVLICCMFISRDLLQLLLNLWLVILVLCSVSNTSPWVNHLVKKVYLFRLGLSTNMHLFVLYSYLCIFTLQCLKTMLYLFKS